MGVIYDGEGGQVTMSILGTIRVQPSGHPSAKKLPRWMKSRVGVMYAELKSVGYDPSKCEAANAMLWEYVLDSLSGPQGGLAEQAAFYLGHEEVLGMMLNGLRGYKN